MHIVVSSEKAPRAIGPYSQAIVAAGLVFCSGQIPLDPVSGQVVSGDIRAQTRRVLENLAAVLTAAGCGIGNVVKTTVFLQDLSEFAAMNEEYASVFKDRPPARATVQVARLPKDVKVEIDCVAVKPA